ncbi:hypothetical protein HYV85_03205 [Candidatus Woesearchaeota archaeon]|nr:hypothetical protein [Candidatus Woesearchaeota archaeon]
MNKTISMEDIWELYGVRSNPFSTSPILVRGGNLPLECFVGRQEQVKRLARIFGSAGGSRTLVYGDVGMGKTSFVNFVRAHAMMQGFFTPFKEIAILDAWNPDEFVHNTLAGIYSTLKLMRSKPISKAVYSKLAALVEGVTSKTIGGSVAGTGGTYSELKQSPVKLTSYFLQQLFQEIVSDISAKTRHDVIIHYNNLDLMEEAEISQLFNNLRDFLQTPKVHFVIVGSLATHTYIQNMPRLSSILSDTPIHIDEMTLPEVKSIIKKRFEALRISDKLNYIIPFKDECLAALFKLYGGNIRNILNSLSPAALEVTSEKPVILDISSLSKTLKRILGERYLSKLTKKEKEMLLVMVKYEEVTNKELAESTRVARPNVSTYVAKLQKAGCAYLRRKEGKDKFWSVDPRVKWMLLKEITK